MGIGIGTEEKWDGGIKVYRGWCLALAVEVVEYMA